MNKKKSNFRDIIGNNKSIKSVITDESDIVDELKKNVEDYEDVFNNYKAKRKTGYALKCELVNNETKKFGLEPE